MAERITRDELKTVVDDGGATVIEALGIDHFQPGSHSRRDPGRLQRLEEQAPERLPDKHGRS